MPEWKHEDTELFTCPHCDREAEQCFDEYTDDFEQEHICDECGKRFMGVVWIRTTFCSRKLEEKESE